MSDTLFGEASANKLLFTSAGDALPLAAKKRAAAPATCGDAMEVPLIVFVAESLVHHGAVMSKPGAKISVQDP